jgi:septal ring factor EnvC (AmiA/AmiB activator)
MKLAALLICFAMPLAAQQEATDAAAQLQAAGALLQAADSGRDQIKALTETVQAYEAGLVAMRDGLRQITLREMAITDDLAGRQTELGQLLGVLTTIGNTPQAVLHSHPQGPLNTARAGMLVADMTPALQAKVTALTAQLNTARDLRLARQTATKTLGDGLQGAQTARAALGQAVSDRTDLPLRFDQDPVQTALLIASAQTLGDFAGELANETPSPENTLTASGDLPLPVAGSVLPDDGQDRPGVHIGAAPRALVITPVPATLLFQGPLLDYGNVVILEPTADVLFVFAGLAEVFGQPGEILSAGAPIGLLGGTPGAVDDILTENEDPNGGQTQQTLYLEVREGQSAVNPGAWFALE